MSRPTIHATKDYFPGFDITLPTDNPPKYARASKFAPRWHILGNGRIALCKADLTYGLPATHYPGPVCLECLKVEREGVRP